VKHRSPAAFEPPPAGSDPVEVRDLRARVAELEQALQHEVQLARAAALREGEQIGLERGKAEIKPLLERLTRSIVDLGTLRSRIRQDSEGELVNLSIAIARRVLRREISVDPEAVAGLLKAALDKVQPREIRRVRCHPDLGPAIRRQLDLLGANGCEIAGDPTLAPGDVMVETRHGDLDASVETQLAEIERGFADRMRR
jgi:flagellar assembly protein FliH